jgi:hypothetical protein
LALSRWRSQEWFIHYRPRPRFGQCGGSRFLPGRLLRPFRHFSVRFWQRRCWYASSGAVTPDRRRMDYESEAGGAWERYDERPTGSYQSGKPPRSPRGLPQFTPEMLADSVATHQEYRMIRKLKDGRYRLYSRKKNPKTGKRRNLGTFKSRAAAIKHERAVQFFKRGG